MERTGLNFRIQANAAVMTKIAVLLLEEQNLSIKEGILIPVHDEIVEEWNEEKVETQAQLSVKMMIKAGTYTCPDVPMDVDPAINDFWEH